MRSPSTMVGFMEPVGTVFQSAKALRNRTIRTRNSVQLRYSRNSFMGPLQDPVEPEQRQQAGNHREEGRDGREQCGDFGLLLLQADARVEGLVDLLQVVGSAGVEVLALGRGGDGLERLLV